MGSLDRLRNIVETGRAGLLFLIPGLGETLRVNGRPAIVRDPEMLADLAVEGKTPLLARVVLAGIVNIVIRALVSNCGQSELGLIQYTLSPFSFPYPSQVR